MNAPSQLSTSTGGGRAVTVVPERHCEPVRRWRWLPWPTRPQWWASFEVDGTACTVVEGSKAALTERIIEHVRFICEDDSVTVSVVWYVYCPPPGWSA